MPYSLEFTLQGLPRTVNQTFSKHWKARHSHNKKWLHMIQLATIQKLPLTPLNKAKITLTRHSSRESDFDGLVSSFKVVLDSLIKCGIIIDDNMSIIGIPEYRYEKAPPRKGFVRITVEEVI